MPVPAREASMDVTDEDIKGEFRHGILRLSIPKKETKPLAEEKKYISIEG